MKPDPIKGIFLELDFFFFKTEHELACINEKRRDGK